MSVTMRIGVKDFVYALQLTDPVGGVATYGTVYQVPGINKADYQPGSSTVRAYGDDGVQASAETVGDQTLTIDMLQVPLDDQARLLGFTKTNGIMEAGASSQSPYVAVGFKVSRDDGSYQYVWFPKVRFQKGGSNAQTKTNTVNFQMDTLEGAINNLTCNNNYRVMIETNDPTVASATVTNWFNAPVLASSSDLGAVSATITKSSANVLYTFAKVGGGNITLTASQLTTASMPVYKGASAVPQAGAYVIASNGTAAPTVTFTPTVAFGTASVSAAVTANSVFDTNNVATAAAGAVLSYP